MSDIFQEARDDLRQEKYQDLVRKYGIPVFALGLFVVSGVAGVMWWRAAQEKSAELRSESFERAVATENEEDAAMRFALLAVEDDVYGILARFEEAARAAQDGDVPRALSVYDALDEDQGVPLDMRHLARIRAGYLRIGHEPPRESLHELDTPNGAFRFASREIFALNALVEQNWEEFEAYYEKSISDPDTPTTMTQRLSALYAQSLRKGS